MGYNLISGCHKCKVKVFHFRGEENVKILDFYIKHKECAKEDLKNVQTIMDNCDEDWIEDFKQGGYKNDEINNFKPKNIKMKKNIIAAAEARAISEANKNVDFNSVMSLVEEYAAQGKTEFFIRDRQLFKKWEAELISLGYVFKGEFRDKDWVLSWDTNAFRADRFSHLAKNDTPVYIDLRLMRNALTGLSETEIKYSLKDLIDLAIKKNIVIGESEG